MGRVYQRKFCEICIVTLLNNNKYQTVKIGTQLQSKTCSTVWIKHIPLVSQSSTQKPPHRDFLLVCRVTIQRYLILKIYLTFLGVLLGDGSVFTLVGIFSVPQNGRDLSARCMQVYGSQSCPLVRQVSTQQQSSLVTARLPSSSQEMPRTKKFSIRGYGGDCFDWSLMKCSLQSALTLNMESIHKPLLSKNNPFSSFITRTLA